MIHGDFLLMRAGHAVEQGNTAKEAGC